MTCQNWDSTPPSFKGFLKWLYDPYGAGIPKTSLLPQASILCDAYGYAKHLIPKQIITIMGLGVYRLTVYQMGMAWLWQNCPDLPTTIPANYWHKLRESSASQGVAGMINSVSDQGTSVGVQVSKILANMTPGQIEMFGNPFGQLVLDTLAQLGVDTWALA